MSGEQFLPIILLVIGFFLYFVPTIVALNRGHQSQNAIFALNVFTGWTALGWVLSLVWALTGTNADVADAIADRVSSSHSVDPDTMKCPICAETIKKAAKVCRFCGHALPQDQTGNN
jgi:hypothetical protein